MKQFSILFSFAFLCSSCNDQIADKNTEVTKKVSALPLSNNKGPIKSTLTKLFVDVAILNGKPVIFDSIKVNIKYNEYDRDGNFNMYIQELPSKDYKGKTIIKSTYDSSGTLHERSYFDNKLIQHRTYRYSDSKTVHKEIIDSNGHVLEALDFIRDHSDHITSVNTTYFSEYSDTIGVFRRELEYDKNANLVRSIEKDILNGSFDTLNYIIYEIDQYKNPLLEAEISATDTFIISFQYNYYE